MIERASNRTPMKRPQWDFSKSITWPCSCCSCWWCSWSDRWFSGLAILKDRTWMRFRSPFTTSLLSSVSLIWPENRKQAMPPTAIRLYSSTNGTRYLEAAYNRLESQMESDGVSSWRFQNMYKLRSYYIATRCATRTTVQSILSRSRMGLSNHVASFATRD